MKECPKCKQKFELGVVFCPSDGERLVNVEGVIKEDPLIGEVIDNKYLVESKVAKGGTASVYRAKHIQLDLSVALKVMHPHLATDKTSIERFRREAFAAMHIRHPNAIAILDFSICSDGMVYVVTEFLSGLSLREKIMQNHIFSLAEANEIMQQACAAVAVAHKRGIIHRDLKPDNIFLHKDQGQEVVKVLDFGIAKLGSEQPINDFSGRLTRHGYVLGTPQYMAPEQCQDKEVDPRTDVYALGVVLYEMLTGKVPFNAKTYSAIVYQKVKEVPPPMYEIRSDVHPLVDGVVRRALAKKQEDRPESVTAFARELELAVRAVTEDEFLNVFQNASEHELEAAILLAGEPARNITGHLRTNINIASLFGAKAKDTGGLPFLEGSTSSSGISVSTIKNQDTKAVAEKEIAINIEIKEEKLEPKAISNDLLEISNQKTLIDVAATDDMGESNSLLDALPDSHYDELLAFTEDASTLLNQEMLNLSKEMVMLLQIVVDDLGENNPLDRVFFTELRANVDALRALMYHLQYHYDQKSN
ncbi:MAG: serine/threonine protein kinase [Acidobacteria bacterium]|nr:serine/threonine protein kinase [Acidobacteriota bacterium]